LSKPINIVIVDDFPAYRKSLGSALSDLGYTILFDCKNGAGLVEDIDPKQLPDIVIMDLDLPQMDGYTSVGVLKSRHPTIRTLAISTLDLEVPIIRILYHGANGFILRTAVTNEFDRALKMIMNNGQYYSDLVPRKLVRSIADFKNKIDISKSSFFELSEDEIKISKFICAGLSNRQIAYQLNSAASSIDRAVKVISKKLQVSDRLGILLYYVKFDLVDFQNLTAINLCATLLHRPG